jgi:glycosyltransferase involved in cell wall biosynthesis
MKVKETKRIPTVWINVTTSANWNRPPVGIIRVEQALRDELTKLLGSNVFKQCIWSDGEFLEWLPETSYLNKRHEKAINLIFPRSKSFDTSRKFLSNALKLFERKPAEGDSSSTDPVELSIPINSHSNLKPTFGDFIISVGLDWDQPYTADFFAISKKKGIKIITCCYDLIPVLFPQYCVGDVASRFKDYFNMLTWGSSAVLCISKQTQKDYLTLCSQLGAPERPTCILPLGDNVPSGNGDVSPAIEAVLAEPFILFVSTIERRKNHEVLYRAYHLLCRLGHKHLLPKLVFVGMTGWGVGDLLKDIELDPLTQGLIIQLNHVNDGELGELYKKALFCVYPSLYEGWGLPVGEALAVGKAVLASNQGSLPEVGGSLVRYLDPWNPKSWADAILELATSPSAIQQMERKVVEQYEVRTWAGAAKSVEQLIDQLTADDGDVQTVLYPGYDMSTQVGLHVGPCIKATGKEGFLIYGPHQSLSSGNYRVKLYDQPYLRTAGLLTVDFVADQGQTCLWRGAIDIKAAAGSEEILLTEFEVCIPMDVSDYEIRCIVGSNNICLSRIVIDQEYSSN